MNAAQLNAVAKLLTDAGIPVTKDLVFAVCIKTLVESGIAVETAIDFVCGDGSFNTLVEALIAGN